VPPGLPLRPPTAPPVLAEPPEAGAPPGGREPPSFGAPPELAAPPEAGAPPVDREPPSFGAPPELAAPPVSGAPAALDTPPVAVIPPEPGAPPLAATPPIPRLPPEDMTPPVLGCPPELAAPPLAGCAASGSAAVPAEPPHPTNRTAELKAAKSDATAVGAPRPRTFRARICFLRGGQRRETLRWSVDGLASAMPDLGGVTLQCGRYPPDPGIHVEGPLTCADSARLEAPITLRRRV
jgi:hypothetical protein